MRIAPSRMHERARVLSASEDGHWHAAAEVGQIRVELATRTAVKQAAVGGGGAELAAVAVHLARCHRTSLAVAGRFLALRGRTYRIEQVAEERDGFVRYQTLTLKEVQ